MFCKGAGGGKADLVSIDSKDEQLFVEELVAEKAQSPAGGKGLWTGLTNCIWNSTERNRYLGSSTIREISVSDAEECKAECMSDAQCLSVNYKIMGESVVCSLKPENKETTPLTPDNQYSYSQHTCGGSEGKDAVYGE